MWSLPAFSMGTGDRFGVEAEAQLAAFVTVKHLGVTVAPVWNKSNREHLLIGSQPDAVRAAADAAVKHLGWLDPYFVDADHIGLKTVDKFLVASDFYTIDVADFTGQPASAESIAAFVAKHQSLCGSLSIPGIATPFDLTPARLTEIARKYLLAAQEAGQIYRHIAAAKGPGNFVTEVSMDETDLPQTPLELFIILVALAGEGVPAQTIAPKFTGRFNKAVDYVGDLAKFEQEFNDDLCVLAYAVKTCGLPAGLKLSVHSGSDKFSLYPIIRRALQQHRAGLHLKTAGTTWLEEVAGLASAGGDALRLVQDIYATAHARIDELTKPYATVIDVDRSKLPAPATVRHWSSAQFVAALRHDPRHPQFNPHFRQLLHVSFKAAAEMGAPYRQALLTYRKECAALVTENLLENHLKPLFVG